MGIRLENHITYNYGQGDPVVFIHGIEEDGTFWYPLDRAVARFRKVMTIDMLGYGKSIKGRRLKYSLSEHVTALSNTIKTTGIEGPVTIVAHSLGCYVAAGFAERYPEKMAGLILISPVVIGNGELSADDDVLAIVQKLALHNVGKIRRKLLLSIHGPNVSRQWRKVVRNFWPSFKNVENLVEKQNFPTALSKLKKIPVQIVYGAGDALVIPANIESLKEANPKLNITALPVGHDVIHTAPVQLFRIIIPDVDEREIPEVIYRKLWRK